MSDLEELLAGDELARLIALASAAAGGARVGVTDPDGRLLAGRAVPEADARRTPVTLDDRVVGVIVGDPSVAPELAALVQCALELGMRGALEQAARARVGQELAIGSRIQHALLPRRFPDVPGWTFAAAYEPAREVGGDLYDAFGLRGRSDRVGLLVADVTGKGIPAALLMADVRALLHAAADNADGPADALGRVNTILVRERATSLFVTAALLEVEAGSGAVRVASAGHEPPLVARLDGRIEALEAAGPILGAFGDATFDETATTLGPGDALVLYTDGLTETRDPARRFYGEARLHEQLRPACGRSADEIVAAIVDDVRAFRAEAEPYDDLTLLVAERRPN